MKIALSIWKDSISTVFDAADQLLIIDDSNSNVQKRTIVKLGNIGMAGLATQIKEKGIEVLICGAISRPLEASLTSLGIQVNAFVRGSVEEVIAAYQNGNLGQAYFSLPGCCRRGCLGKRRQNRPMRNNIK